MKIKEIKIANYLGIENIGITDVDEKGAAFTGASRKGKTSILDAIVQAVANDAHREKFVRDEEHPAKIYIKMDTGLEIMRTFTSDGKKNTSVSIDGGKPNAPETYLKKLLGDKVVMIDPNIMMLAGKDKELTEQILALLPIKVSRENVKDWLDEIPPVDYTQHGLIVCKDIETLYYSKRADLNREAKIVEGGIDSTRETLPEKYEPEKWRNIVLSDLFNKVSEGKTINQSRALATVTKDSEKEELENFKNTYDSALFIIDKSILSKQRAVQMEIDDLETRIAELRGQLKTIETSEEDRKISEKKNYEQKIYIRKQKTKDAVKFIKDNPPINTEALQALAINAEEMKGFLKTYDQISFMVEDFEQKTKESKMVSEQLDIIRSKPADLLRESNLPIKNFGINEKGRILINDLPLKNLSTSELLELLCDIEIAKTSEIQFVCVDRWESLGYENTEIPDLIKKKFSDAGIQLFYTRVTSGELTISEI